MKTVPTFLQLFIKLLLAFIFGISLQRLLPSPLPLLLCIFFTLLTTLAYYRKTNSLKVTNIVLMICFCIGGMSIYALHSEKQRRLKNFFENHLCSFRGTIHECRRCSSGRAREKIIFYFDKILPQNSSEWLRSSGQFEIYLKNISTLEVGDYIEIANLKIKPTTFSQKLNNNPSFDFYLAKENIIATLHSDTLSYKLLSKPYFSIKKFFSQQQEKFITSLSNKLSHDAFILFSAIFLGNKKQDSFHLSHSFNTWGLSHYLARSGLHVVIITTLLELCILFLPISLIIKRIFLLLFLLLYWQLSWTSISFLRAMWVYVAASCAYFFQKSHIFLYLLLLVCFFSLCITPFYLFFLDFQLTFLLTIALSWFNYYQSSTKNLTRKFNVKL